MPHPDPKGLLDKSVSLRVEDFTQKVIPDLIIPGGGGGVDKPIIDRGANEENPRLDTTVVITIDNLFQLFFNSIKFFRVT